jgi:hypothetical protein
MRAGESYRLEMTAVAMGPSGWPTIDLPRGAIITLVDESPDDEWFVKVVWKDKTLRMYKVDLRDRCVLLRKSASA